MNANAMRKERVMPRVESYTYRGPFRTTGTKRRMTGAFADIGPWKRKANRHSRWHIEIVILGRGFGIFGA